MAWWLAVAEVVRGKAGPAFWVEADNGDPTAWSNEQRHDYLPEQVQVSGPFDARDETLVGKHRPALYERCYLLVAQPKNTYGLRESDRQTMVERGVAPRRPKSQWKDKEKPEYDWQKADKRYLAKHAADLLQHLGTTAEVLVVDVDLCELATAVVRFEDRPDLPNGQPDPDDEGAVMHVFSAANHTRVFAEAWAWAEALEGLIQEQLAQGARWEDVLREVRDSKEPTSLHRRDVIGA